MTGPVALVTGAGSGIGRAAALRLARDGWAVAAVDIDGERAAATAAAITEDPVTEDPVTGKRGSAVGLRADVADEEDITAAVTQACERLGPLGAFVGSAGVLSVSPALDLPAAEWRRILEINLTGAFLASRAAARVMVAEGAGGRIVQVASVHSVAPGRGVAHYDASKGGLLMLVRSLALELAPHQITVNAIGPGLIQTNLTPPDPVYLGQVIPTIPLKRSGQPEDVAGAIAFLCGPEASYMTGTMMVIDGGMLLTAHT
jgi:NAD(P)-dependent dehydrogenase (short-subunit alcohol dehydrogenase family)